MKVACGCLLALVMVVTALNPLFGGDADPKGIIMLTSASGLDPRNILFDGIAWTDFYGGTVTDTGGETSAFANKDIGRIVYFDSQYYSLIDRNEQTKAFRAGLQAREIVANTNLWNLTTPDDLKSVQISESTLEDMTDRYPAIQALIQPQIDMLKDDISHYSNGQRMVTGNWMSQEKALAEETPQVVGGGEAMASFTTKDGKKYVNARVSVTDGGLSVLTDDGGASVSFDQLPNDISGLPESIRGKIIENRKTHSTSANPGGSTSVSSTRSETKSPSPSVQLGSNHQNPVSKLSNEENTELDTLISSYGKYWDVIIIRKFAREDFPNLVTDSSEVYEIRAIGYSSTQYRRRDPETNSPIEQPSLNMVIAMQNSMSEPAQGILVTTSTSFTSRGRAEILGLIGADITVKMEDGFDKKVPLLMEVKPDAVIENRIRDLLDKASR